MKKLITILILISSIFTGVFAEGISSKRYNYKLTEYGRTFFYNTQVEVYDLKDEDEDCMLWDLTDFFEEYYDEEYYDEDDLFDDYFSYAVIEKGYVTDSKTNDLDCFSFLFLFETKEAYKTFLKDIERAPVAPDLSLGLLPDLHIDFLDSAIIDRRVYMISIVEIDS